MPNRDKDGHVSFHTNGNYTIGDSWLDGNMAVIVASVSSSGGCSVITVPNDMYYYYRSEVIKSFNATMKSVMDNISTKFHSLTPNVE